MDASRDRATLCPSPWTDRREMIQQRRREIGTVLIDGFYGYKNAGDEAILAALVQQIRAFDPDCTVVVASEDPTWTNRHHDVDRAIRRYRPSDGVPTRAWLRQLGRADRYWIGGGGLFGERKMLKYAIPVAIARAAGTDVATAAVGSGPFPSGTNRLAGPTLSQADVLTVRDKSTAETLRDVGVTARIVPLADPVFGYECDTDSVSLPAALEAAVGPETILVAAREPADRRVDVSSLAESLSTVATERDVPVVFVPFHVHRRSAPSDVRVSRRVASRLSEGVETLVWDEGLTHDQLLRAIDRSRLVVGMRLHSIIFAANVRTPFVGVPYSPKCVSHLERLRASAEFACDDVESAALTEEMRIRWDRGLDAETVAAIAECEADSREVVATIQSSAGRAPTGSPLRLGAKIGIDGCVRLVRRLTAVRETPISSRPTNESPQREVARRSHE